MARGIQNRDFTLDTVLKGIYERLRRLERPSKIHLGGAGNGFSITTDVDGNLVAVSDSGTRTIIAVQ